MAGFLVSNFISDVECFCNYPEKMCKRELNIKGKYSAKSCTSNKLLADKIFECNGEGECFIIEGSVLNKNDLIDNSGTASWIEALSEMKNKKEFYFTDFRGAFSGAHYSPDEDAWVFYTNHLGDHPVFYWNKEGKFIVTSDMNWMVDVLKSTGVDYTLDKRALMGFISYGWIDKDRTIVAEVRKLLPGHCIKMKAGSILSVSQYHRFINTKFNSQSENEIIEEVDKKFRHAIALEYNKDKEYGYEHMACLSGGLDSRMNVWVAKDMGYNPITTITFGQSESEDIEISNQVAKRLGTPHLVKTLDDADFFSDIPDTVKRTFGLLDVSGGLHGNSVMKLLDLDKVAILHTGLIGDGILGSKWRSHVKASELVGKVGSLSLVPYDRTYDNAELYFLYEHVMHWTLGIQCGGYERIEYASPFTDIDFWEYCLTIPLRYRYNHYIYKKWILKYYPEAAEFNWETIGGKLTDSDSMLRLRDLGRKYKRKLRKVPEEECGMNPFDYWYQSIPEVRNLLDGMMEELLELPCLEPEFRKMIKNIYDTSGCRQKTNLLSALQSVKEYFGS